MRAAMLTCRQRHLPQRERGIVLIVALIVMVALSFAGVALVRSVDTTTAVVGNLAFRQAAISPANLAVEQATAALFANAAKTGIATITNKEADMPAENYYARLQAGEDVRGIPVQLQKKANFTLPKILYADANKYFEVRYVIERMCIGTAPLPLTTANRFIYCDMMPPKQGSGTTVGDTAPPDLPKIPFYRLTVRVDGPQNTTAFLQAMLR
jgi:Tfp pilus assembly protein PilX